MLLALLTAGSLLAQSGGAYFPGPGNDWERRSPRELGFDPELLQGAVEFALAHETSMAKDPGRYLRERFANQPHQQIVGPTRRRGGVNGLLVRHGYIAAEWGDTARADMTFSVTKSYLSTLAGLALEQGLIPDLDQPVSRTLDDPRFQSAHNAAITWRHLLQQTSEWQGTLWEKPDAADRRRGVDRRLRKPGTFWEYNDVRVNLLAYCLLRLFRRPLPEVLAQRIMDPIGASDSWRWHGYRNSFVTLEGRRVQSVSGGGHWGGGLWISSRDHARFGYLFLRKGVWRDRQLIAREWIESATTACSIQPRYGFMWWLNTGRQQFPSVPESSFFAIGAGSTNLIWVDPDHDLVLVSRWVEGSQVDAFLGKVLDSIQRDR